ncbi:MAG: DUF167 domain-containing protein [bacterium]|nr:DUF167 domain-containing protein [bacterium]
MPPANAGGSELLNDSITFTIRVVARASKSEIVGEVGGLLKVRISAPPVDGAANREVVRLLAKAFGVAKSSVSILSGEISRTKRVRVIGATPERLLQLAAG